MDVARKEVAEAVGADWTALDAAGDTAADPAPAGVLLDPLGTVFTKNRDRLLDGDIAAKFFQAVLGQPQMKALLSDKHFLGRRAACRPRSAGAANAIDVYRLGTGAPLIRNPRRGYCSELTPEDRFPGWTRPNRLPPARGFRPARRGFRMSGEGAALP